MMKDFLFFELAAYT